MNTQRKALKFAVAGALALGLAGHAMAQNPCAGKKNPCSAKTKNPCGAKPAANPCAAKSNPCAAKGNPCAAKKK